MKNYLIPTAVILFCSGAAAASKDHEYLHFEGSDRLIISGPFDVVIPKPDGWRTADPVHSSPRLMMEQLQLSKAGFFSDEWLIVIEIETTDAAPGTLSNENLPTIAIAGSEFRARSRCVEISQQDIDAGDVPMLEFIQNQNFDPTPAVFARQLFVTTDDGTGEGIILFARRIGSCENVTDAFSEEFDREFEKFVVSVRNANPDR